ncbi:MAG TPA: rhodanese-like domain-containing protein [Spirochaetes bacterium]|nr:rhodanese-like domain-containing protein [Spirochaetota bacterium]
MKISASLYLSVLFFFPLVHSTPAQDAGTSFFKNEIELAEYIVMPEILVDKIMAGHTDFVLYDIRSKGEYDAKHVTGAVNLPWEDMAFQNEKDSFSRDKDIFIISGDGTVSFDAVRFLIGNGFSWMYCIEGGMDNWLYKDLLL